MVFALGLGDRLAGVTRFDRFPPEVAAIPKVGGFLDPSYEAILAARPSLVLLLRDHREKAAALEKLGLRAQVADHSGVEAILRSIGEIGSACAREREASDLARSLRARMQSVSERARGRPRQRALVVLAGARDAGHLRNLYVSGSDGFYSDLLRLAGAENAYGGPTMSMPAVSVESLIEMDPDIIFEIVSPEKGGLPNQAEMLAAWRSLPGLRAAREGRVHFLSEERFLIPGPRFVETLEELARALYPSEHPGTRR